MKKIFLLLYPFLLFSCTAGTVKVPDSALKRQLSDKTSRIKITQLIDNDIEAERKISISVNQKSPESLELMRFLLPVLHDRDHLDISFWFLDGNSDEVIMSFLRKEPAAPTAEELLFKTDPRICGYREYEDFLLSLQDFYQRLADPENMTVGNSADSFLRISLYESDERVKDRRHYLLHSPLLRENRSWELPFDGMLYFMMIHDWFLEQYTAIEIKDSALELMYLNKKDRSEERSVSSYLDGIILMGYPERFSPFNSITSFINEKNISEAVKFYPHQLIREKTKPAAYLVNSKVDRKHRQLSRSLKKQYERIRELEPFIEE